MPNRPRRSACPLAGALDLIGDRWSMLVIRDLMFRGRSTYCELLRSPEGISTNILAERLRRLEAEGLLEKRVYQERPRRYCYCLTPKGDALRPMMIELVRWGSEQIAGTIRPPILERE